MRNRPITRTVRLGAVAVLLGALLSASTGPAQALTTTVGFSQEGTFWRLQQRTPIVDIPCNPPIPQDRCGPASPGPTQSPEVPEGTIAVGHGGGGVAGEGNDPYGDQYWAVFEVDLLSVENLDSIDKLELTVSKSSDGRSDFGTPTVMACNIVTPFGVSEGTNPWADRPSVDCSAAKAPTTGTKDGSFFLKFNVADFAATWVAGTGYGVALVPGVPGSTQVVNDTTRVSDIAPFHITFVASGKLDANRNPHPGRARATLQYEEKQDSDFGFDDGDIGFGLGGDIDDFAIGDDFSADGGDFAADFGAVDDGGGDAEVADGGTTTGRALPTRQTSGEPGFPWAVLLLLPLVGIAFWGTGTALGEAGDPTLPRQGGVSRILARRRAAATAVSDSIPR